MTNRKLESALRYEAKGYHVIPIKERGSEDEIKRPYVNWTEFQTRKPTQEEIKKWWAKWPNANIGLLTGLKFDCIDIDTSQGLAELTKLLGDDLLLSKAPTAQTPRKGRHIYVQPTGIGNKIAFLPGVDYKGKDGYSITPPSDNYAWLSGSSGLQFPPIPEALSNKLSINHYSTNINININGDVKIQQGTRDETLFHIANALVKGRMPPAEITQHLTLYARNCCDPPFPLKEIPEKIKSALNRDGRKEANLSHEIRTYIESIEGTFYARDLYNDLNIINSQKNAVRQTLHRLKAEGVIEQHSNNAGCFRKLEGDLKPMNLLKAQVETLDLWLPLGIHKFVEFMPGNIITIAGDMNAGKTAFLLNIIKENIEKYRIHYFNSEMGESELKKRLLLFDRFPIAHKNFSAYEREDNFADVIRPGKDVLNVIDYLEIVEDFWKVGKYIKEIHSKLDGALAIIALQKRHPESEDALGGKRSLEKPRLALSMFNNRLKIIKAKNWKTAQNPSGLSIGFKLVSGAKFIAQGEWENCV